MAKRERWDKSRPDTKKVVDEIVHGVFVKEGTMVAFPTCFPGVTTPIPRDEGRITALDLGEDGLVYGGTSGVQSHIFVGMFHGVTGIVFDLGVVPGTTGCRSVNCLHGQFSASLNGPEGGRVIFRSYQPLPYDLIQEWGFSRAPFKDLGVVVDGERILDTVAEASGERIVGVTESHLFTADPTLESASVREELDARGRIARGFRGGVIGVSSESLWRFDVEKGTLDREWRELPSGCWEDGAASWARDPRNGVLYVADGDGQLFSLEEDSGFSVVLGRTQLPTVGPMAITFDGRLFGTCGSGISRLFKYEPWSSTVSDLGVAVSVIERRRYGYQFGAATVGRNGEIILGENDDLGHLWLYFPRILAR